ncbi:FAD-dependent oxidoreductase [Micromonospora sp. KLBMP9576]|uniref:FAD-dependent oxidoreductase n=1 Tax=Micromonospora sp. KLBMP9576 TaxID=3424769 RepID=UPI003D90AD19
MLPTSTDVLVVGAGPTGLTVALALGGRGVRVAVVDRLDRPLTTSRAAVVHAYTLEMLDRIGAGAPLVARGLRSRGFTVRDRDRALLAVPFDSLPSRHAYALMISQSVTEEVLAGQLAALGVPVLRPYEMVGLTQDATGVVATFADGATVRARYLVGADGMHSAVRERAGIGFSGPAGGESFALADVRVESALPRDRVSFFLARSGPLVWAPLPDGIVRLVAAVPEAPVTPDRAYFQALLDERGPVRRPDRLVEVLWGSRFRIHHRVADTFRSGRVLLAGDAGHVHSPAGGQGMNLGIVDAVDVGDTLADVLAGAPEGLLDGYAARRRPMAEEVVAFAARLTRLATLPPAARAPRNLLIRLANAVPPARHGLAMRLSGLNRREGNAGASS